MINIRKPLPLSIINETNIQYNPSLNYEEGENIYSEIKPYVVNSYSNPVNYRKYLARQLATDFTNLQLDYIKTNNNRKDITYWCSKSEYLNVKLKLEDLDQFENIIITEHEEISENSLNSLLCEQDQGITYFGNHDTLLLPKVIKHFLEQRNELDVIFLLFNMDLCPKIPKCLNKCNTKFDVPKLEFKYLPDRAVYTRLKERYYKVIPAPQDGYYDYFALYTNLPREFYKNIVIENKIIHYNITNKWFCGHIDLNQTSLNFACKDLCENLPKEIIVLKLLKGGYFMPILCYKQLLSSMHIDYPSIPVCIIIDPFALYDCYVYKKFEIDYQKIKEFLKPYFLLND